MLSEVCLESARSSVFKNETICIGKNLRFEGPSIALISLSRSSCNTLEIDFVFCLNLSKSGCIYHFLIDLEQNGILFDSESIQKWKIQSDSGWFNQNPRSISKRVDKVRFFSLELTIYCQLQNRIDFASNEILFVLNQSEIPSKFGSI